MLGKVHKPSLLTSEQLIVWAWSDLLLDWWPPPAIESNLPDQSPLAGIHLAVQSRGPPPPWPLAAFSSSSAQWYSVNTTPSWGSACQLRRFTRVWRLKPTHERLRRWMKTRVVCPPCQAECSCQTTKVLSLSRAPYIPDESINRGLICPHVHSITQTKQIRHSCPRQVNVGNKNTPSMHHPQRRNVTTPMVWLKKWSHTQKSHPIWWTPEI